MSNLIVVANITAKEGQREVVRAALEAVVPPSRAESGCLRYELHVDNANADRFVMLEEWTGAEALAAHEKTAHFRDLVVAVVGKATLQIDKLTKLA
ncbi:putative quinol monooxygenase [Pseudoduganella armeniaca]|jgi:quinol monooxygenase YgiN|uniref:Antibiotic biosynthesis monooxygenase n=1 Tax=Pseudoduganella armeniaca TaxID=2072590 RepID=A0A2R4CBT1_9BURK|nr:putative quinol monooxygenase [Pseudoduganella armeniaca]AVR97081.1 antibiotic biosynthesis monooxygenase [Pseudoduganella armeniaca]